MGTRHLVGTILNGKYVIAQYGQWDGYIDGQGSTVLNFLKNANIDIFKEKLSNCRYVTQKEVNEMYVKAGAPANRPIGWVTVEVNTKFCELFPSMGRDIGAGILELVYNSTTEVPLTNSESFLNDELFCEYAYVINLDTNTLVCYVNGNHIYAEYPIAELPDLDKMKNDLKIFRNS